MNKVYKLGAYGDIYLDRIIYIALDHDESSFKIKYKSEFVIFIDLLSGIEILSVYTNYLRDKVLLGI